MKQIWNKILEEAKNFTQKEPFITSIIEQVIHDNNDFWTAIAVVISGKLKTDHIPQSKIKAFIIQALDENEEIKKQIIADLTSYFERDFACETYLEVVLFYRGFQAVTAYRIARSCYLNSQKLTSKFLQNRIFEVYGMDIHPNAKLGKGIVIDHGIGVVIGETAEIGDHAFIFHNVTLGGTGHAGGNSHPKVKNNVFIGAGATILGNITINDNVNIAAGSIVTKDVQTNTTVAGVPAKVIGEARKLQ